MPTYRATGVTARLSTCDLHPTLTTNLIRTMGAEYKREHERIEKVFSSGNAMLEQPIGEDGSAKGVVTFIGANEDMPLFVVEAGNIANGRSRMMNDLHQDEELVEAIYIQRKRGFLGSDDSPLTSLGDTPEHSASDSPNCTTTINPRPSDKAQTTNMTRSLANRLALMGTSGEQAIVLDVNLSQRAFLPVSPSRPGGKPVPKDLKIEVFLNGELVDVDYVSSRFSASHDLLRFTGKRIHRQVEKPWVYSSSSTSGDASQRWRLIANALAREAERRGQNKFSNLSPSAQFLLALAGLDLPQRLTSSGGLAVFDVIITAGKGQKYGAMTSYITAPTRMDDPDFTPVDVVSPPAMHSVPYYLDAVTSNVDMMGEQSLDSYPLEPPPLPETSSRQSHPHKVPSQTPSPTKKTAVQLQVELGLRGDADDVRLATWERASGRAGKGVRSLKQRLGDMSKMSPSNQDIEMARLKLDLGSHEDEVQYNVTNQQDNGKEQGYNDTGRVKKKAKRDHAINLEASPSLPSRFALLVEDDPFVDTRVDSLVSSPVAEPEHTMSPLDMFKQWPKHISAPVVAPPPTPTTIDPALTGNTDAVLTQSRTDMALNAGLTSDGPLLRRIAASSPQHTPPRRTSASALSNSPTVTPVKPQQRSGPPKSKTPKTGKSPQKHEPSQQPSFERHESPLPAMPAPSVQTPKRQRDEDATNLTPGRSGRGANRTAATWDPMETTIEQSVAAFRAGEVFEGSCVRYAEGEGVQRQIGKARAGEFKEACVVVGMRFVVI